MLLKGSDRKNNQLVAIKVEKQETAEIRSLERESIILDRLKGSTNFPKLLYYGSYHYLKVKNIINRFTFKIGNKITIFWL